MFKINGNVKYPGLEKKMAQSTGEKRAKEKGPRRRRTTTISPRVSPAQH